jgi:hypothetical protein
LWAAKATKFGCPWKIGNGLRTRFWEDRWIGSSTLATQFWDIYVIANDHNVSISKVWDGLNLKITFRRYFSPDMMKASNDLFNIVKDLKLNDSEDSIVWNYYDSKGIYTVKSLYSIIYFRGVLPTDIP